MTRRLVGRFSLCKRSVWQRRAASALQCTRLPARVVYLHGTEAGDGPAACSSEGRVRRASGMPRVGQSLPRQGFNPYGSGYTSRAIAFPASVRTSLPQHTWINYAKREAAGNAVSSPSCLLSTPATPTIPVVCSYLIVVNWKHTHQHMKNNNVN